MHIQNQENACQHYRKEAKQNWQKAIKTKGKLLTNDKLVQCTQSTKTSVRIKH
jgi:hypothetical protein